MPERPYAAFLSYAHRYQEWVAVLHRNLERCLEAAGISRQVFLDRLEDSPNAAELKAAIARCLARIDELRKEMRRKDAAIDAARKETLANLADIADVLAELKAA